MNNEQPITPPPELVQKWRDEALILFPDDAITCPCDVDDARDEYIATQAARWGSDQELDGCCEWLGDGRRENLFQVIALRAARRPKPPSLKKQALAILSQPEWSTDEKEIIRQALELLPDEAV